MIECPVFPPMETQVSTLPLCIFLTSYQRLNFLQLIVSCGLDTHTHIYIFPGPMIKNLASAQDFPSFESASDAQSLASDSHIESPISCPKTFDSFLFLVGEQELEIKETRGVKVPVENKRLRREEILHRTFCK